MSQKKFAGLAAALLGAALVLPGCGTEQHEYSAEQEKAIVERIRPVGAVVMEGEPIAAASVSAAPSGGRTGGDIYQKSCFACHTTGAAGAPKYGDSADWQGRVDKGVATLLEHAWNGFKTMPAKGNCFDCSEEEMEAAVQYILDSL